MHPSPSVGTAVNANVNNSKGGCTWSRSIPEEKTDAPLTTSAQKSQRSIHDTSGDNNWTNNNNNNGSNNNNNNNVSNDGGGSERVIGVGKAVYWDPNGSGFYSDNKVSPSSSSNQAGKKLDAVVADTPGKNNTSEVKASAATVCAIDTDAASCSGGVSEKVVNTRKKVIHASASCRPTTTEVEGKKPVESGGASLKHEEHVMSVADAKNNEMKPQEEKSTLPTKCHYHQEQEEKQEQKGQEEEERKKEGTERCQQSKEHTATAEPMDSASQGRCVAAPLDSKTTGLSIAEYCTRPAIALSVHLVVLYKKMNEVYCRQRRLEPPGPKFNNGFDDKEGHYLALSGEEILNRYTVQEVLGKGSFGTVVRCYDEKRRENVALKITRHGLSFRTQAKLELDILLKLNSNPHLNQLVVKLLKVFDWQGHLVLVFELLSFNLYHLIKCTRYNGVTLDLVRKFAYQMIQVLYQLERTKPSPIIHCDIKPENILLRSQNRSGIRLIDFGSACYSSKVIHKYIQSRYYRSPEVILYLEYGTAIDRWSLGCVLAELHTGMPLFDGRTEVAQLARFEAMLGPLPADMVEASPKMAKFYEKTEQGYRLKEQALPRRSLDSVLGVTSGGPRGSRKGMPGHSEEVYRQFFDFLAGLLRYRPSERISCYDALRHPFVGPLWTPDQQQQSSQKPATTTVVQSTPSRPEENI